MASGNKWFWGCGLGCGGLILVVVLGVGGVLLATRSSLRHFQTARSMSDSLVAVCGGPADWAPAPDGVPAPQRLEAFLAVRDSLRPAEQAMATRLLKMRELVQGSRTPARIWRLLHSGLSSVADMGRLAAVRNRALLRVRMNPGEFAWLSVLVYHDWLGKPFLPDELIDDRHVELGDQEANLRRLIRSRFLAMADSAMARGNDQPWLKQLSSEQGKLIRDPDRWPWEDGLPGRIIPALAPFRRRLEATGTPLACFTAMLDFGASAPRRGRLHLVWHTSATVQDSSDSRE